MPKFQPQYSFEATTLDYLSPNWYGYRTEGSDSPLIEFETKEEADAFLATKKEAYATRSKEQGYYEPTAFRVTTIPTPAERDAFLDADFAANRTYWADRARAADAAKAARDEVFALRGQTVEVTSGRKVPKGTRGEVFWVGEGNYGGYRLGLKETDGTTHWTAATNVTLLSEVAA